MYQGQQKSEEYHTVNLSIHVEQRKFKVLFDHLQLQSWVSLFDVYCTAGSIHGQCLVKAV